MRPRSKPPVTKAKVRGVFRALWVSGCIWPAFSEVFPLLFFKYFAKPQVWSQSGDRGVEGGRQRRSCNEQLRKPVATRRLRVPRGASRARFLAVHVMSAYIRPARLFAPNGASATSPTALGLRTLRQLMWWSCKCCARPPRLSFVKPRAASRCQSSGVEGHRLRRSILRGTAAMSCDDTLS